MLRTVVGGARTLFAPRRSFTEVSPSSLRTRSRDTPIVASATKARAGEVSMRVTSAAVLTLATPADAQRCVFARDEPERAGTQFVTIRTAECRAASAPGFAGTSIIDKGLPGSIGSLSGRYPCSYRRGAAESQAWVP